MARVVGLDVLAPMVLVACSLIAVSVSAQAPTRSEFIVRNDTRCDHHMALHSLSRDALDQCQRLCEKDKQCTSFSLNDKTGECFLFGEDASCHQALMWTSGFKDTRAVRAVEGSVARMSCPKGMYISNVKAKFNAPGCTAHDVSDIVQDLCLQQQACAVSVARELFLVNPECKGTFVLSAAASCEAGVAFYEDEHFSSWSSANWDAARAVVDDRRAEWKQYLENVPTYPEGKYRGRGIIIVAGGRYLASALVSVKMLRDLGCTLRIQIWHLGPEEVDAAQREVLAAYDVEPRDFTAVVPPELLKPIESNVGMRLFQLKPLALLYSDLQEVLLIDSDNTPLMDPTYLFSEQGFQDTGTVFWPDYWKTSFDNPIWAILGMEPKAMWEQESGQLLINKRAAWRGLNLCVHFNSAFYMGLINGDKDTFRFAWLAAGVPFVMNSWMPSAVGTVKERHSDTDLGFCSHTMLQHDLQGRPLFVHHNQLKHAQLPLGENFRYMKSLRGVNARVLPVAGLDVNGAVLPCNDVISGELPLASSGATSAEPTGLGAFEVRYFAATYHIAAQLEEAVARIGTGTVAATQQQRQQPTAGAEAATPGAQLAGFGEAESLLIRDRRVTSDNVTTNCNVGEFELAPNVCEYITACEADQVEMSAPTATSDRVCEAGPSYVDPILQTITVTSDGAAFNLAADGQAAQAAPAITVSQGGRYLFQLSSVPTSSSFVIEDGAGATVAGPATEDQGVQLQPGELGVEFTYYDGTGSLTGNTITVDTTTSYSLQYSGYHGTHTGPYQRYNTAYDPSNHLFTRDVFSLTSKGFSAARTECRVACSQDSACTGFYVYVTDTKTVCHGLAYLGEPTDTLADSESWIKVTQVN
ncbi:hypothetical protein PTSG_07368 [Salpingoeca rosetta]|uniref:Apple domain-containing protein n=1 Tax=Salpingoeca rosetta (strain ATCC 50818 / BSB-021) TaxID=946362 RepID=F2UJ78_SALR5|nr:uncharacterized protein PTSG_07368 [Salpingoeca rosetta]EGD77026.1 hypothetical protein PTSG_07368 [Salpingoeca rosetta]|eukprot:XP_004990866.1 hypothetical protein PTSG_07368 [Salpingoeca rosetta]